MKYIIGLSTYYGLEILLAKAEVDEYNRNDEITMYSFRDEDIIFNYNWEYEYSDGAGFNEESVSVREFDTLEEAQRKIIWGLFV